MTTSIKGCKHNWIRFGQSVSLLTSRQAFMADPQQCYPRIPSMTRGPVVASTPPIFQASNLVSFGNVLAAFFGTSFIRRVGCSYISI